MSLSTNVKNTIFNKFNKYQGESDSNFITFSVLIGLFIPTIVFILLTGALAYFNKGPAIAPLSCSAAVPIYLLAFYFIKKDRLGLAKFLILLALFSVMLFLNISLGNGQVTPVGYAMTALLAAFLQSFQLATLFIILGTVAYGFVGYFEQTALIIPSVSYLDNHIVNTVALLLSMSVIVILGWLSKKKVEQILQKERSLSAELTQRKQELEKYITDLKHAELKSRHHAQHLEMLREITKEITILRNPNDVLRQIIKCSLQLLQASAGGIYVYRPELDALEWRVAVGEDMAGLGVILQRGEGVSGKILNTGKAEVITNYSDWDGLKSSHWPDQKVSVLCVPIKWSKEILGVLNIRSDPESRGPFNHQDVELMVQFADIAAIALKNAQLFDKAQQEIREREQAEKSLSENERKYRMLMENLSEGVCLLSSKGRFKFINPTAGKIFGIAPEKLITQSFPDFISEPQKQTFYKNIDFRSATDKNEFELKIYNVQKILRDIYVIATPQNLTSENEFDVLCMFHDITEQKQLEDQLAQAQKLEAIGNLTGGIAHDFNNILTAINGYAEIAAMKAGSNKKINKELEGIIKAGTRGSNLTRQLLAFSRKQQIEPAILNVNDLINDFDKMLKQLIGEDISVDIRLSDQLDHIKADKGQLEQVIINLVVNARDAINQKTALAREKQIIIETQTFTSKDPKYYELKADFVKISVTDNGVGMDPNTRNRIFDPFFTTKEEGEGTGLGLSTVYGIINQNNGHIFVDSIEGKGTTFSVYWPTITEAIADEKHRNEAGKISKGVESILVVEDDRAVRDFTSSALESLGYHVLQAKDGQEAYHILENTINTIDLIITDLVMPNMDGKELFEKIDSLKQNTRVIFTSGYINHQMDENLSQDHTIQFIQKPFTLQQLSSTVRSILET